MESRSDALTAGVLAGPLAMFPAMLFYLAMVATWPGVSEAAVPADHMMQRLDISWLKGIFYLVVFGTFVETGTAFIHAVNERIDEVYMQGGHHMPRWVRPCVALFALVLAVVLAGKIGLIDLIAQGYGTITWFMIAIYVLPLLTLGLWRLYRAAEA